MTYHAAAISFTLQSLQRTTSPPICSRAASHWGRVAACLATMDADGAGRSMGPRRTNYPDAGQAFRRTSLVSIRQQSWRENRIQSGRLIAARGIVAEEEALWKTIYHAATSVIQLLVRSTLTMTRT